jgi:hypothetical protein
MWATRPRSAPPDRESAKVSPNSSSAKAGRWVVVDLNEEHANGTVQEMAAEKGEAIFAKCDLDRNIRSVGHEYKKLIEAWTPAIVRDGSIRAICQ